MKISFAIHDINKNGGQERSTLEIVNFLSLHHEIEVLAASHGDLEPKVRVTRIPVLLRKPLLVKDFFFRIFASMIWARQSGVLHHATGSCVFKADALTIQFLQKRWLREIGKVQYVSTLKALKERLQVWHDYLWEELIFFLNRKSRFFAISDQVAQDLRNLYGVSDVVLIPHGVNQQDFLPHREAAQDEIEKRYPETKGKNILLFVGAFERKGLRTLIEALAQKPFSNENWHLLVVGAGPIQTMQKFAGQLQISQKITFAGSQQNVALFFQASDLFILPSHYDPFGLVGIEALACGCPAVISQSSGCSALIKQGENGFVLADSRDSQGLSGLISHFFSQPEKHHGMREQAHRSTQGYNWKNLAGQYEKAFLQIGKAKA